MSNTNKQQTTMTAVDTNNAPEWRKAIIDKIDNNTAQLKGGWKTTGRVFAECLQYFEKHSFTGDLVAKCIGCTGEYNVTMSKAMKTIAKDFFGINAPKLNEGNGQWVSTYKEKLYKEVEAKERERVIQDLLDGNFFNYKPKKASSDEDKDKDKTFTFTKDEKASPDIHAAVKLAHYLADIRKTKNMDDPVYKEVYKTIQDALAKAEEYLNSVKAGIGAKATATSGEEEAA